MDSTRKIYIFLSVAALVLVLIYAQAIILPFIISILFWIMIRIIRRLFLRIGFMNRLPVAVVTILSTIVFLSLATLIIILLSANIHQLSQALPGYEKNIDKITASVNNTFGIDAMSMLSELVRDARFTSILTQTISAITGLFGKSFLVMLYLLFLLLEERTFPSKLTSMYPDKSKREQMGVMIKKIDSSISYYLGIKTMISLMTGAASFIVLLIIGVEAPLFWAFLIFILNYIPTIGSLVATLFPTIFALFQFGEFTPALLIFTIVSGIQLLFGNLIEPRIMGNSLNISPLVVFLTLAMWGMIWGIAGMLLSVPITVMLIIIMSEFEGTRPVAILLSRRGVIAKSGRIQSSE
ncbi:MAG: AI-2E family transporter [Bacteroidales bacterium]|nr:AI-2E family transporter [Bacteroidales bacterium]